MKQEELDKEINRIQTFLGDGYEVSKCNGAIRVDKKPDKVKITCKRFYFKYFEDKTLEFKFVGDRDIDIIEDPRELCIVLSEALQCYINNRR